MSLRSALGVVRGLGSAREGTHHWWLQRLTAVALVPLSVWFVLQVLCMARAEHAAVVAWLGSPVNATLLAAFVIAVFWHTQLGMQVVFEDYVHGRWSKVIVQVVLRLAVAVLALAALVALLQISLR